MTDVPRLIKFMQTGELDMTLSEETLAPIVETDTIVSQIMSELIGNPGICPCASENDRHVY